MLDEACCKWITLWAVTWKFKSNKRRSATIFYTIIELENVVSNGILSSPLLSCLTCVYIYFPSLNLHLSVHPFRFCGWRSKRTHALRFGKRASSSLFILERAAWALDSGTDAGKSKKKKTAVAILSQWELFSQRIPLPETVLILERIKKRRSPYVVAVSQVSVLNGSDLKTMINYTGEQVSPLQKAPPRFTSSVFSLPGSSWELLICWVGVSKNNFLRSVPLY